MAQKKKTSKNRNTRTIPFKNFIKNPITWVVIGALCFGVYHFGSIWYEKRQFQKLDQQAYGYIQAIAQKYPGKVTHERYCDYSSTKFSKGSLGCTVASKIEYQIDDRQTDSISAYAEGQANNLNWGTPRKKLDDTSSRRGSSDRALYFSGNDKCWVDIYSGQKTEYFINASCSGNTRAEHYPVR
ncbi:MAG: hypothetical protein QG629_395 [Patescibacteria group bacterium]|nr:hypothetical protein [Patescibacteria group bacterium]